MFFKPQPGLGPQCPICAEILLSIACKAQGGGGRKLKKSEHGGSVYFFGSEIWLKFIFLGEKDIIIFWMANF